MITPSADDLLNEEDSPESSLLPATENSNRAIETVEAAAEQNKTVGKKQGKLPIDPVTGKPDRRGIGGRPKWQMPDLKQVESLAAHGLNYKQIAAALGMHYATLVEKKEFAEFNDALKRGKAKGLATVTAQLMNNIRSGKEASIFFYLKCQAGWRDMPTQIELSGKDGGPIHTFAMDFGDGGPGEGIEVSPPDVSESD